MEPEAEPNAAIVDAPADQTHTIVNKEMTAEDFAGYGPNIKALVIDTCTSRDWKMVFQSIADLKQIEQLTIRNSRFSKDHLPPLEKSSLRKITLEKTSFEDYDLVKLRVPTLTHLVMKNNPINEVEQAIPPFQARWQNRQVKVLDLAIPKLTRLSLVRKDDDQSNVEVTSNNLSSLSYRIGTAMFIRELLKMDLKLVFGNFPFLTRLTLTNFDTQDGQLDCIAELKTLKILHVDKCNISSNALMNIAKNLTNLRELDLSKGAFMAGGCKNINAEFVHVIVRQMRNLQRIFVGSTGISEHEGLELCYGLPRLSWLSARQNNIGKRGDKKMKILLPRATVWAD